MQMQLANKQWRGKSHCQFSFFHCFRFDKERIRLRKNMLLLQVFCMLKKYQLENKIEDRIQDPLNDEDFGPL